MRASYMHADDAEIMISQKLFLSPRAIEINLGLKHPPSLPHPLEKGKGKASRPVTAGACQCVFIAWIMFFCNLDQERLPGIAA
jgi:hypothetical protein